MRIALLGSADGHESKLRFVCEFILSELNADRVLYLARDHAFTEMRRTWVGQLGTELVDGDRITPTSSIWQRSLECLDATAEQIDRFVARERSKLRLERLEELPNSGVTTLELDLDLRLTACYERDLLTDEDVEASRLIASGHAIDPMVRRSGGKYFLSPGSFASAGAMLLSDDSGQLVVSLFDGSARLIERHDLESVP